LILSVARFVTPAKVGVQAIEIIPDSRLCENNNVNAKIK